MDEPLFPFRPNWKNTLLERLEWSTDVFESKNATEDRISLRALPRRSLEYTLMVRDHSLARLDAMLWRWQAERFVVPIWTDPQRITSSLPAGETVIPAVTADYDFAPAAMAVLWGSDSLYEVVQIASVETNSLTLVAATAQAWPAGTKLFPARFGRLPDDVSVTRRTDTLAEAVVRFDIDPSVGDSVPSPTVYRGMDVNLRRPNWAQSINTPYRRKVERVDYGTGPVFVDDLSGLQGTRRTHNYLLKNRADITAYRGWLHARSGRANAFWQPQLTADLVIAAPVSAAAVTITVHDLDYTSNYNQKPGRQDVAIRHRGTGQWYFRRVLGAASGAPGYEVLTLDAALGISASPADLAVHWLAPSRLEADAIEIAWHTDSVAVSVIDIRSVRQ